MTALFAPSARCFAAFAPASIADYLDHVWLGVPDARDESALVGDGLAQPVVLPATSFATERAALLDAMTALYGGDPRVHARALLSQWSKVYFGFTASAGFAVALLLGRPLDMRSNNLRIVLRAGMPVALIVDERALGEPVAEPAQRYRGLIDHLRDATAELCRMTTLSPRVVWSNAGNLLDALFEQCASEPRAATDAAWLFGPLDAHGDANPLHLPVRRARPRSSRLPNPFRARRVCCLRNEIPGETRLCGRCPLLLTMTDEGIARQEAML